MKDFAARRATRTVYDLAESPVWDPVRRALHWVDIPAGMVLSGRIAEGTIVETGRVLLGESVGAVAIAEDGGLLIAAEKGLATIDESGAVHRGPPLLSAARNTRLNDGACDPAGRYLVGSLAPDATAADQVLLQVETNGFVTVLRSDIGLSNGIAWSPSGDAVYHVDTTARTVSSAAYDPPSGRVGPWRILFTVDDGLSDGLTVDEDGFLWIAVWGRGQVRRYDLAGTIQATVTVDAPLTSSVAFVGPDLDTLAITTARSDLTPNDLARYPSSGALFLVQTGVRGLPEHVWAGNTAKPVWR
jgi:sugar lactone lactonase YvrE